MEENRKYKGFYLNTYQSEFVQKFLSPNSNPYHLLFAPIGSGKTAISSVIVGEMVKSGARKILVLTPALALVDQYKKTLGDYVTDIKIMVVDRKMIREIESLNQQKTIWNNSLAITTLHQASSDEIRENFLSIEWELIIIDGIENISYGSKQEIFIKDIVDKHVGKRILALSSLDQSIFAKSILDNDLINRFEVTKWKRKDLTAFGQGVRSVKINTHVYKRTKEEISFIKKYSKLSKRLSGHSFQEKIRLRLVSSSLYAAEESLRNLRNRLVHGDLDLVLQQNVTDKEYIKDEELLGDIDANRFDQDLNNIEIPQVLKELTSALDAIELIETDSKYNALVSYLRTKFKDGSRVLVYASYKTTISYLYNSLLEVTPNVYQLHGGLSSKDSAENLNNFRSAGGILVASSHLITGLDLPLDVLAFYDIPENEIMVMQMLSRAYRKIGLDIEEPIEVYISYDDTNVLRSETTRYKKLQKIISSFSSDSD